MSETIHPDGLTPAELEHQDGAELPAREAMTLINPGLLSATPVPLDGTAGQATDYAGQTSNDAASLTNGAVSDAAAGQSGAGYAPDVTSIARS